jgi:hypothetical protein
MKENSQNWRNIYVLPFKTMAIMASCFFFKYMNVKVAERLIKTIKHKITVMSTFQENVSHWDLRLLKVLFGFKCGIQASTKFSPFMVLIGYSYTKS